MREGESSQTVGGGEQSDGRRWRAAERRTGRAVVRWEEESSRTVGKREQSNGRRDGESHHQGREWSTAVNHFYSVYVHIGCRYDRYSRVFLPPALFFYSYK